MRFPIIATMIFTCLAAAPGRSAPPEELATPAEKAYVADGSVVHDVGRLLLNVTNWGLLGSRYSVPSSYSDAPSARWPGEGGVNHLWSAGLWIGAVTDGVPHVTTGQYATELRATEAPADTIYRLAWNAPLASRYPLPGPDDDGDGVEDEDPFNGRDDDGDAAIDEDAGGVGNQHFRCELDDLHAGDDYPDHVPLGLAVVQQSYQWNHDSVADIVGFDFTIRNVGGQFIEDVYVGMFSDFDIDDPQGGVNEALDDRFGSFSGLASDELGQVVPVAVGYMYEGAGATVSGYLGWVVLDHPVDSQGQEAPVEVGMHTCQRFEGTASYENGGDPTNDIERYDALNAWTTDGDMPENSDYRFLVSTGPFASLAPGEEMTVSFALVAGADLDAMLENAADAVTLFRGQAFDRDGDPANGQEFVVRWLGPDDAVSNEDLPGDEEVPPPPSSLGLAAAPNPFNPALEVRAALPRAEQARVTLVDLRGREVRVLHDGTLPAGESRWVWDGRDATGEAVASGVYLVNLETSARVIRRTVTLVR